MSNYEKQIAEIKKLLKGTIAQFQTACEHIARTAEEEKSKSKSVLDLETDLELNKHLIDQYLRVGTGRSKTEIAFYRCPGHTGLERCSRALQEELYGKEVEVAVRESHGWRRSLIKVSALSGAQARLVFTKGRVRTYEEQIEHANKLSADRVRVTLDKAYTVVSNGIILHHTTSQLYTESDLKQLLLLLKAAGKKCK